MVDQRITALDGNASYAAQARAIVLAICDAQTLEMELRRKQLDGMVYGDD